MPFTARSAHFGTALLTASLVLSAGCSSMGRFSPLNPVESSLLFQPAVYPIGDWSPESYGVEEISIQTEDKLNLVGWYAVSPEPRFVGLFCHGNAGNVSMLGETLRILADRHRISVLAIDYRGYGKSEGKPSESGLILDAKAARQWLQTRTGVAVEDQLLLGQSLGGAVAVASAAKDGARGLVLASTFKSAPAVAKEHFRWLPTDLLMSIRFNSIEKIREYKGPLFVTHGSADEVVPYDHGQALFNAAAGSGPKMFYTIKDGTHNSPLPEEYRIELDKFLDSI